MYSSFYEEPYPYPPDRHPQQSHPFRPDGPLFEMIVSRYLSEPNSALAQGHSLITPLPEFGSESFTRLSKVRRAIRRGRGLTFFFGDPGEPFKRLEFWTAAHPLSYKLRLYQVSEPKVNMWQGFTWETLRYWNDLMSGEDVPRLDESRIPDLGRLIYAEPFAD